MTALIGAAACLFSALSGCGGLGDCLEHPMKCQSFEEEIKAEDAMHPEYNPTHAPDVCAAKLPHYTEACATLAQCREQCGSGS